jgi:hypothetical protein
MFEEFSGIPLHPLLVHAAVVFVPLQVLAVTAYIILPFLRRFITWVVVALALVGPLTAFAAKLSGDAFRRRLIRNHTVGPEILSKVAQHSNYGNLALYCAASLGLLTVVLVMAQAMRAQPAQAGSAPSGAAVPPAETITPAKRSVALVVVLTLAVLGLGGATSYFVFKAGDTGAHIVWSGL